MKCPRCDLEITGIREICPQCGDSVSVTRDIVKLTGHRSFSKDWYCSRFAITAVIFTFLRFLFFQEPSLGTLFGYSGLVLAIIAFFEISLNQGRIIGKTLAFSALFNFIIYYFLYFHFQQSTFFH